MLNMTKMSGKTNLTTNSDNYGILLSKYQPKIIKTESENEYFLEVVEELLSRNNLTPEEDAILELLVKLIEDFEEANYSLNNSTPSSRLLHLIDAKNLDKTDLIAIFGNLEAVDMALDGKSEITSHQADLLANLFRVDVSLFTIDCK